jgi:predicted DNA-binding protein
MCMHGTTSIRLSSVTRDSLKNLASVDGLTIEQEVKQLLRAERQRRMGDELAAVELTDEENEWLGLGLQTARET